MQALTTIMTYPTAERGVDAMADKISLRQAVALGFVAVLSPLIRRFPRVPAEQIGRSAYLSVIFTVLPLALAILLFHFLFFRQKQGTDLGDIFTLSFGKPVGRGICALYSLWLSFYAGFLLRSGADRFITTVFHGAAHWVFILSMLILCLPAALGKLRYLGRSAMIFRPLMASVLLLIPLISLPNIDLNALLPVTKSDLVPNALGALETANVFGVAFYVAFLGRQVEGMAKLRDYAGWGLTLVLILLLITVSCIGMFGAALCGKLTFPFFMLVRDVGALGALERIEPVIIAIWVFSDFIMLSLLLYLAGLLLQRGLGGKPKREYCSGLGATLCCFTAFFCAGDLAQFRFLSETLVPLLSALFVFGFPLAAATVGKARKVL